MNSNSASSRTAVIRIVASTGWVLASGERPETWLGNSHTLRVRSRGCPRGILRSHTGSASQQTCGRSDVGQVMAVVMTA